MHRGCTGHTVTIRTANEPFEAFMPDPLPPVPDLNWPALIVPYARAAHALGRLDGMSRMVPNLNMFMAHAWRKEAALSSAIEGSTCTLADLLMVELGETPAISGDDVSDVLAYVAALTSGLNSLQQGMPVSLRFVRNLHEGLMRQGKQPGLFRQSQQWIGGTRPGNATFVPPPADEVLNCLNDWERFLYDDTLKLPVLVKAGLAHVQFDSIHPFLQGNSLINRLLIPLYLCSEGVLQQPLLYFSLFLRTHQQLYAQLLAETRQTGDWERWLNFFMEGIETTANHTCETAHKLLNTYQTDRQQVLKLGRSSAIALRLLDVMQANPVMTIPRCAEKLDVVVNTAIKAVGNLQSLGIVSEVTGQRRNRVFVYTRMMDILNEGLPTKALF
jgi:Fic family protein